MKYLKTVSLVAVSSMALTAFGVSSASATTLEVGGTAKTQSVAFSASLAAGSSTVWRFTGGSFINTCTAAQMSGATSSPFTATAVGGPLTTLSFANCSENPVIAHNGGSLTFERIAGTTNATVRSSGTELTTASVFGTVTCKTGTGTDIGVLTGASSGDHATLDINAVMECGPLPFLVSALWQGTYTVTTPTGLGVVS